MRSTSVCVKEDDVTAVVANMISVVIRQWVLLLGREYHVPSFVIT